MCTNAFLWYNRYIKRKGTTKVQRRKNMQKTLNNQINQFNHILTVVKGHDISEFGGFHSFIKYVSYMVDLLAEDLQDNASEYVANYESSEYYNTHEQECETWHELSTIISNVHNDIINNDLSKCLQAIDYLAIIKPFDLIH